MRHGFGASFRNRSKRLRDNPFQPVVSRETRFNPVALDRSQPDYDTAWAGFPKAKLP